MQTDEKGAAIADLERHVDEEVGDEAVHSPQVELFPVEGVGGNHSRVEELKDVLLNRHVHNGLIQFTHV